MRYLILDVATTAIDGAHDFMEAPSAPSNYKDPEKIAAYIADEKTKQGERCGLDPDLGRITAIGTWATTQDTPIVHLCRNEDHERDVLTMLATTWLQQSKREYCHLVGYNSLKFDWPFLVRRAMYLGVPLRLELDRFKSPHIDLAERLTHRGLLPMRSLGFYVKRLGWTDLSKPLSGAEEARVPQTGLWAELEASVIHDVTATKRLAEWLGVLKASVDEEETVLA
jgi:hypothetical protein